MGFQLENDWIRQDGAPPFIAFAERFGPNLRCTRPQLVELLYSGLGSVDLRFGNSVDALEQKENEIEAAFDDGSRGIFDLVEGTDGLHSRVGAFCLANSPIFTRIGAWRRHFDYRQWLICSYFVASIRRFKHL
jgi:2-polyprenyl-6-methoxyphenol hydroxylase-like FAD-dependent oxidoreductase